MSRILYFELKKILKRRITWITFIILFSLQIFLSISGNLGTSYVNDTFIETHAQRNRIDRANGIALSGRLIDDELLEEMQQAYARIPETDTYEYLLSQTYQEEVRPYSTVYAAVAYWISGTDLSIQNITADSLYQLRRKSLDSVMESYRLSATETAYWQDKNEKLSTPFTYEYADAYASLTSMMGAYMTCMFLTFFIAICISTVFTEEHIQKTDQLILCTRKGRNPLYRAKILAGCIVTTTVCLIFSITNIIGSFICYGPEGFTASLQIPAGAFWYPYPLSIGQTCLIMLGILFLSSLLAGVFTMVLAEALHNSIGAMAVVISILFASRLVMIPSSLRFLSQIWNYIPINILKLDQGFMDLRLISLFGIKLTSWQFVPILYLILILLIYLIGEKIHCRSQING